MMRGHLGRDWEPFILRGPQLLDSCGQRYVLQVYTRAPDLAEGRDRLARRLDLGRPAVLHVIALRVDEYRQACIACTLERAHQGDFVEGMMSVVGEGDHTGCLESPGISRPATAQSLGKGTDQADVDGSRGRPVKQLRDC